jgi:hypothetical protein
VFTVIRVVLTRCLLIAGLAAVLAGCSTDDAGWFKVRLLNDTGAEVVIRENCIGGTHCHNHVSADPIAGGDLAPDASVEVWTYADGNAQPPFVVLNASGSVLGCLPMKWDHPRQGVVVNVSKTMVNCGSL